MTAEIFNPSNGVLLQNQELIVNHFLVIECYAILFGSKTYHFLFYPFYAFGATYVSLRSVFFNIKYAASHKRLLIAYLGRIKHTTWDGL